MCGCRQPRFRQLFSRSLNVKHGSEMIQYLERNLELGNTDLLLKEGDQVLYSEGFFFPNDNRMRSLTEK